MSDEKVCAVVGVGPGLGGSVAKRFAREGYAIALMARKQETLKPIEEEIQEMGARAASIPVDATDPASVAEGFDRMRSELGPADVLVYNAGAFKMGGVLEVDEEAFQKCLLANCAGAYYAARQVLPNMVEQKSGTVLFTGATASLRGGARFSCLATGKFGLRALAQSMARELGPQGIHVAHVIIDGQIDTPRIHEMMPGREAHTLLQPDRIADVYWHLHTQDPTTWTQELDLRPSVEKF